MRAPKKTSGAVPAGRSRKRATARTAAKSWFVVGANRTSDAWTISDRHPAVHRNPPNWPRWSIILKFIIKKHLHKLARIAPGVRTDPCAVTTWPSATALSPRRVAGAVPSLRCMSKPELHIALALVHQRGTWLVALRKPQTHLGSHWEFPGGKQHAAECATAAALRELREECAVDAEVERVLAPLTWEYDDRVVRITPVICRWIAGVATPLGCTECRWVTPAQLRTLRMPPANEALVRAVTEQGLAAEGDTNAD